MKKFLVLIFVLFLFPDLSFGKIPSTTTDHASIEILAESKEIKIGENFVLGIKFDLDPGWHTYWKNPGDSGLPPDIKWSTPKGINQRPLMSNDEIRKWLASGMDIGAHTQTHVDLTSVSKEKAAKEINRCKDDLEDKFDISIVDFCYPFGKFDDDVCNQVKMAGFSSAVTMIRGRANKQFNELKLPRIPITYHTLPHLFLIKILSKYEDKRS